MGRARKILIECSAAAVQHVETKNFFFFCSTFFFSVLTISASSITSSIIENGKNSFQASFMKLSACIDAQIDARSLYFRLIFVLINNGFKLMRSVSL